MGFKGIAQERGLSQLAMEKLLLVGNLNLKCGDLNEKSFYWDFQY